MGDGSRAGRAARSSSRAIVAALFGVLGGVVGAWLRLYASPGPEANALGARGTPNVAAVGPIRFADPPAPRVTETPASLTRANESIYDGGSNAGDTPARAEPPASNRASVDSDEAVE